MYYNYLPELQGITDIEQQKLRQYLGEQEQGLRRQYARMGMQSGGGLLGGIAAIRGQGALGLSDIFAKNMLQNALLGREERLTKEARDWQKQMAQFQYEKQKELMDYQQKLQMQQMLGSLLGQGISTGLNWLATSQGWNMSPLQGQIYNYFKENPGAISSYLGF